MGVYKMQNRSAWWMKDPAAAIRWHMDNTNPVSCILSQHLKWLSNALENIGQVKCIQETIACVHVKTDSQW